MPKQTGILTLKTMYYKYGCELVDNSKPRGSRLAFG